MTLQNRQGTPIDKLYRAKQRAPLFALGVNLLHNQHIYCEETLVPNYLKTLFTSFVLRLLNPMILRFSQL